MSFSRAASILGDFALKQAQSCAFAFGLVAAMAFAKAFPITGLARYDFLFLVCVAIQALMVLFKWESWRELWIIAIFHVVGVVLEWFKVASGSWSYPEEAWLKISGVPLYGGFMYAAVASYMSQAWRRLELDFTCWPRPGLIAAVVAVVYIQFFLPVQTLGLKIVTLVAVLLVFARTRVAFTSARERLWMPVPLAFLLIGVFIYICENLATYFGAWTYPYQADAWQPVHLSKVISWALMVIVGLSIIHFYRGKVSDIKRQVGARDEVLGTD
jgi:uncharacterized membrane protein YoaT (DUF817 family)